MFLELDLPLTHERRVELARQVSSERIERELRAGRRGRRWSARLVRGIRLAPDARASGT